MPDKFYGQQGEDKILYKLFKNQLHGVYVDVGASDGVTFSNTYVFEKMGWHGVCLEPHPVVFKYLKANRPGSQCFNVLAGEYVGAGRYVSAGEGISYRVLSQQEMPGAFLVNMVSLDFLLTILGIEAVDFISIDVEYSDYRVVQGLDLKRFNPRVVVVEQDNEIIDAHFKIAGYQRAKRHYFNSFFCRTDDDAEVIRSVDPRMENGKDA